MLFTSIQYFIFLFIILFIYYTCPNSIKKTILLFSSLFFYSYVNVSYLLLLLVLLTINYYLCIWLDTASNKFIRKRILHFSLFINIGVLVFFKYLNFLITNFFNLFHITTSFNNSFLLNIALPLGLSYYTFQILGYLLDIYRGSQKAEKNLLDFSLFIIFFPKLLVGPIERTKHFLPQIKSPIQFNTINFVEGSKRIAWGLFKKLVVADRISLYQTIIDTNPQQQSGITVFLASILYTFQVYADFSGYSDIAIGSARLFGYNLLENFNQPFLAKNLSEFWRRWHISLSSWVNDYIFNPTLYLHRTWGIFGVFYALFISFFIIGIWHGATWNFIIFGILQAVFLSIEALTKSIRKTISSLMPASFYNSISVLLVFLFISFSLIIFRTPDLEKANNIIQAILHNSGSLYYDKPSTLIFILTGCIILIINDFQREYKLFPFLMLSKKKWIVASFSYVLLLIYILIAAVFDGGQFIYFSF